MLHAVYFSKPNQGCRTISYNNRYVESETFNLDKQRSKLVFLPAIEGDPGAVVSAHLLNLVGRLYIHTLIVIYLHFFLFSFKNDILKNNAKKS